MLPLDTPSEKGAAILKACDNYKDFMEYAEKQEFGANLCFFAGQGSIRGRVMAYSPERPTEAELEAQKKLVHEAMEAGFLGITTGFVYAPSVYCDEDEAAELCKVVAEHGGVYSSHIRDEADGVVEAVQEAINVANRANAPTVISQLKVTGAHHEALFVTLLDMMDTAKDQGSGRAEERR